MRVVDVVVDVDNGATGSVVVVVVGASAVGTGGSTR
jgi:hypothetical protein